VRAAGDRMRSGDVAARRRDGGVRRHRHEDDGRREGRRRGPHATKTAESAKDSHPLLTQPSQSALSTSSQSALSTKRVRELVLMSLVRSFVARV